MKKQLQKYAKELQQGDKRVVRPLLLLLKKPLYIYLCRLSGSVEIAEDLLQESLMAIYTGINTFDTSRDFLPWAYVVTKNKFLEFTRKKNKIVQLNEVMEKKRKMAITEFSDKSHLKLDLSSALQKLNLPIREAFILKHFQNMTFAEISEIQKIPVPTAKSRVLFALQKIRKFMQENKL